MRKEYQTVCIQMPEHKGELLASHVWVHHAQKIKEVKPDKGEKIRFTAMVRDYKKMSATDYCLDIPEDVHLPDREAIALRIPEEQPLTVHPSLVARQVPSDGPVTPQEQMGGMVSCVMLGKVKALAKEVGGWDQLDALMALLRD